MYKEILQITSIILTLGSAIFLERGNLGLSVEDIAKLASTRIGANPDLVRSLSNQEADSKFGVFLLLLSFALQMIAIFITSELMPNFTDPIVYVISFLICSILFGVCWKASNFRSKRKFEETMGIIHKKQERE